MAHRRWLALAGVLVALWPGLSSPARAQSLGPSTGGAALGEALRLDVATGRPAAPAYSGCGGVTSPVVNDTFEQLMVEITNQERLNNGSLPPLKRVAPLTSASRYHSADMAQDAYFDHDTYDRVGGALVLTCGFDVRIDGYYANWLTIAENIAAGYATAAQAMAALMGSPGHRDNILNTSVWEQAAGYAAGGPYGHYWTQDFGRRQGVYPLIINREAASTTSAAVQLYVYGNWSEIRLRNESGTFGPWQPFSANITWTLSGGAAGQRTVFAEMRQGGTTASASDDILLTAGAPTPTPSRTQAPTATPPATSTPTRTASATRTATATPSRTATVTPSRTATATATRTATASPTRTLTASPAPPATATPLPIARGDCNGDRGVNAGDISALSLELFDGDGTLAANAPGGTYPGQVVGCDANGDGQINAGDVSCTTLLIFNGPGACP